MIHEPLIAGGVGGSATSIERTAESIMKKKRIAVEALAADTAKSRKEVETAISFDNYMNAEEAKKADSAASRGWQCLRLNAF